MIKQKAYKLIESGDSLMDFASFKGVIGILVTVIIAFIGYFVGLDNISGAWSLVFGIPLAVSLGLAVAFLILFLLGLVLYLTGRRLSRVKYPYSVQGVYD